MMTEGGITGGLNHPLKQQSESLMSLNLNSSGSRAAPNTTHKQKRAPEGARLQQ
jgi:hypothetical protein